MKIELIFQILAIILLTAAAYFFWGRNNDLAFFFLVLSACSFFMNVRFQAKARLAAAENAEIDESSTNH